jgi:hypothetical protein
VAWNGTVLTDEGGGCRTTVPLQETSLKKAVPFLDMYAQYPLLQFLDEIARLPIWCIE